MEENKFQVGDIITVADPADPSHFKRFQKVIGTLPVEEGCVPYSLRSFQNGRTVGPHDLEPAIKLMMFDDIQGRYKFRSIPIETSSTKAYFESMYRVLTEQERLIYIHE